MSWFRISKTGIIFLCIISLSSPSVSQAEEPTRGRLPDGRAFRTDVNGNEIVDYIAELELAVETMTRKMHGLEDEIEERNSTIARLRASGANESEVKERDLLGSKTLQHETENQVKPEFVNLDCKDQLEDQRKETMEKYSSCQARINFLEAELKKAAIGTQHSASATKKEEEKAQSERRASLARETTAVRKLPKRKPQVDTASLRKRAQQEQALEVMKGSVRTALNSLKGKMNSRQKLFSSYAKSGKSAVTFSLRTARAQTGRTVAQLGKAIEQAPNARVLSGVKRDILEIQGIINEDVALLERLMKGRKAKESR